MSTRKPDGAAAAELAANAVSRQPRQGRSRASFERMLATTRQLMLERGSEDFTLQEVSDRGNVSIGSIYLRFQSKDDLLHAVIGEVLREIADDERDMIARVLAQSPSLSQFVPTYVEQYSLLLAEHAPLLRLIMQRASFDAAVSEPGKETARNSARRSVAAILTYGDEIGGADPERRAGATFEIVFATIARRLSLGSTAESAPTVDWEELKQDLAEMCLAYLTYRGARPR